MKASRVRGTPRFYRRRAARRGRDAAGRRGFSRRPDRAPPSPATFASARAPTANTHRTSGDLMCRTCASGRSGLACATRPSLISCATSGRGYSPSRSGARTLCLLGIVILLYWYGAAHGDQLPRLSPRSRGARRSERPSRSSISNTPPLWTPRRCGSSGRVSPAASSDASSFAGGVPASFVRRRPGRVRGNRGRAL